MTIDARNMRRRGWRDPWGGDLFRRVMGSDAHRCCLSTMFTKDIYQHYGGRREYRRARAVHSPRVHHRGGGGGVRDCARIEREAWDFEIAVRTHFRASRRWRRGGRGVVLETGTKWGALRARFNGGLLIYFAFVQKPHKRVMSCGQIGQGAEAVKVLFLNPRGDVTFWNGFMTVVAGWCSVPRF